jgi:hypothetical protein
MQVTHPTCNTCNPITCNPKKSPTGHKTAAAATMEDAMFEMPDRAEVLLAYVCVVDTLVLALVLVLVLVSWFQPDNCNVRENVLRNVRENVLRNVRELQHANPVARNTTTTNTTTTPHHGISDARPRVSDCR